MFKFGFFNFFMIDKKFEIMLVMVEGIKNGDMCLGLLFVSFKWFCLICFKLLIFELIVIFIWCVLFCEIVKLELIKVCLFVVIFSWIKWFIFLVFFFLMYFCGLKLLI